MVYLLKADVADILEIKCDMVVTQKLSKTEKVEYLKLLYSMSKRAFKSKEQKPRAAARLFSRKKEGTLLEERFDYIVEPIKKPAWVCQAALFAATALLMLASYSFVLQPAFDPPEEDIYTNNTVQELETAYFIKHKDGTYSEVFTDGVQLPVPEGYEDDFLSQGYEIVEE